MTDDEALKETRQLMNEIIDKCNDYAQKDGLSIKFVLNIVGKALIDISQSD